MRDHVSLTCTDLLKAGSRNASRPWIFQNVPLNWETLLEYQDY